MQKRRFWLAGVCALLGVGMAAGAQSAQADEVYIASLQAVTQGGTHAMFPHAIKLLDKKPDGIKKEPAYRYTPRYGMIALGDAKDNQIAVALDMGGDPARARLYVDANGSGDLTAGQPLPFLPLPTKPGQRNIRPITAGTSPAEARYGAETIVTARYNVPGRGGQIASRIVFTLWNGELTYNREYGRIGSVRIGDQSYMVALVDQNLDGKFGDFQHGEEDGPKVTLLVDKNGDGVFDMRKEAFDASSAFRIGSGVYEVASIDPRGMRLVLKKSSKAIKGAIDPKDLKPGSDIISFEATLLDGKTVHFPDDYKGKIVLLDFWATWCPPCREEVPGTVAVYNQYHAQGFDILGISLDQANARGTLLNFMRQYGMAWPEVYDGKFWNAEVAKMFAIDAIPMSFLVDSNTGKILAMGDDLRGDGLRQAVEKALAQKSRGR